MSDTKPIDDGGLAFPEPHYFDPSRGLHGQHMTASDVGCGGMSLRDYFAGQAMNLGEGVWPGGRLPSNAKDIAENCYALADALIAEKRRREQSQ